MAILGGVSGSFGAFDCVSIPPGVDVVVAVDEDEPGERFAEQIVRAAPGRPIRRLRLAGSP